MAARRRLMAGAFVVVTVLLTMASPAFAGGSWFDPVKDRYEPGDEATLVGYTGGGAYGWIEDGPFFGFLVKMTEDGGVDVDGMRLPLGEVVLEETGRGGYLRLRASITFLLPADLEPAVYQFDYCNADCSERLGDLIGGAVWVGVDAEFPISREWPLDDPEVANLDANVSIAGPGFQVSAGDVQSGAVGIGAGGMPTVGTSATPPPITQPPEASLPEVELNEDVRQLIRTGIDERDGSRWPVFAVMLAVVLSGFALVARRRNSAETAEP